MEDRSSRRVRTLVTQTARSRCLSANQIACALISMRARSTCSNQRPDTLMQDRIARIDETSCTAQPDSVREEGSNGRDRQVEFHT
jgi:hypothetical protein